MAVTDGPLQSLPLSILVTKQPKGALLNYEDYREVSWLTKSYALTTLPSVSSLRALQLFAKDSETADPFAGFGDPALGGTAGGTRGITLASLFSRGPIAAVDEVRKLTPLPDTAGELREIVDSLGAEWVIMIACNTAAPDGTPGAEGLSGLAKAFLYAGGRALLVSHWPMVSVAATEITTRLFEETAGTVAIGRAEALRRSMLALMETPDKPYYAHPLFWAPFVVVGEGAAP